MNNMNTKMKSQQLVKMAMMAALACVVGLIRFPLIPAVSFLTYDFADIPILITTFAFGPASGLLVLTVVSFIQAFLMGGDGFYGFIMHIIASGVFLMIAGLMYRKHKTKKVAILSMLIATLAMTLAMGVANYYITTFYLGGEAMRQTVVGMMPLILAFNLIKGGTERGDYLRGVQEDFRLPASGGSELQARGQTRKAAVNNRMEQLWSREP